MVVCHAPKLRDPQNPPAKRLSIHVKIIWRYRLSSDLPLRDFRSRQKCKIFPKCQYMPKNILTEYVKSSRSVPVDLSSTVHCSYTPSFQKYASLVAQKKNQDIKLAIRLLAMSELSSPHSTYSSFSLSRSGLNSGRSSPWSQGTPVVQNVSSPAGFVAGHPRIQVASLLTETNYSGRSYQLTVVQHPQRTAEFGAASLSRLPLSPPIVVQLVVRDRVGNPTIPEMELPFLIAHLSLFSDDGSTPLDMGSAPGGEAPPRRLLYGNLVSSPQRLRDLQGRQGLYFLFPDVSIRWRGHFQIAITLLRLSRTDSSGVVSIAEQGTVLAHTRTRSFEVVSHRDYVAPAQTRLTQCFLRQGARMYASTSSHLNPQ